MSLQTCIEYDTKQPCLAMVQANDDKRHMSRTMQVLYFCYLWELVCVGEVEECLEDRFTHILDVHIPLLPFPHRGIQQRPADVRQPQMSAPHSQQHTDLQATFAACI